MACSKEQQQEFLKQGSKMLAMDADNLNGLIARMWTRPGPAPRLEEEPEQNPLLAELNAPVVGPLPPQLVPVEKWSDDVWRNRLAAELANFYFQSPGDDVGSLLRSLYHLRNTDLPEFNGVVKTVVEGLRNPNIKGIPYLDPNGNVGYTSYLMAGVDLTKAPMVPARPPSMAPQGFNVNPTASSDTHTRSLWSLMPTPNFSMDFVNLYPQMFGPPPMVRTTFIAPVTNVDPRSTFGLNVRGDTSGMNVQTQVVPIPNVDHRRNAVSNASRAMLGLEPMRLTPEERHEILEANNRIQAALDELRANSPPPELEDRRPRPAIITVNRRQEHERNRGQKRGLSSGAIQMLMGINNFESTVDELVTRIQETSCYDLLSEELDDLILDINDMRRIVKAEGDGAREMVAQALEHWQIRYIAIQDRFDMLMNSSVNDADPFDGTPVSEIEPENLLKLHNRVWWHAESFAEYVQGINGKNDSKGLKGYPTVTIWDPERDMKKIRKHKVLKANGFREWFALRNNPETVVTRIDMKTLDKLEWAASLLYSRGVHFIEEFKKRITEQEFRLFKIITKGNVDNMEKLNSALGEKRASELFWIVKRTIKEKAIGELKEYVDTLSDDEKEALSFFEKNLLSTIDACFSGNYCVFGMADLCVSTRNEIAKHKKVPLTKL